MSEERPLSAFSSSESADTETADDPEPPVGVAPAPVTYRWQPAGSACENCGTSTETQWLDDGVFVCPDCKDWA